MYLLETRKQSQHQWRNFNLGPPAGSQKWAPNLHLALYGLKMAPFGPLFAWALSQLRALRVHSYATGQH